MAHICDTEGACHSPMTHTHVSLVHRNYYNTHISDTLLEVCTVSVNERVNNNIDKMF